MAASFLSGHAGITPSTIENSAAYLAGWIRTLKGDKRHSIAAAGAAQKAADWIVGVRPGQTVGSDSADAPALDAEVAAGASGGD